MDERVKKMWYIHAHTYAFTLKYTHEVEREEGEGRGERDLKRRQSIICSNMDEKGGRGHRVSQAQGDTSDHTISFVGGS